jgi:hypothetical protein
MPTARWFAESRLAYARALTALAVYARDSSSEFTFGPLDLAALENQGLAVTGDDLAGVRKLLGGLPGIAEEQG